MAYNLSCFLLLSKSRWLFSTQIYLRKLNKENFIVTNDIWFSGSQFLFMICTFQAVHSALQHEATHQNAQVCNKCAKISFIHIKVNKYQRDFLSGLKPCLMGWSALNTSQTTPKSRQSTPISSIKSEPLFWEVIKRNYDSVLLNLVLCKRHFLKWEKKMLSVYKKKPGWKVSHSMSRVDVGFQRNH